MLLCKDWKRSTKNKRTNRQNNSRGTDEYIGLIGGVTSSIEIYNNPEQLTGYLAATGAAVLIKKGIDKFRELHGDQRVYDIIKGIGLFGIGPIGASKTINLLINHYDQLLTYYSMIGSVTTGLKGIDYLTRKKEVENPDL